MSEDSLPTDLPPGRGCLLPVLIIVVIALAGAVAGLKWQMRQMHKIAEIHRQSDRQNTEAQMTLLRTEIEDLEKKAARRETEIAARDQELAQREAAIAGREDAATERTQSSFQGLLIQQNLLKNLEALKASLPDMTPEVERLAKEHAQFDAELQRLRKENAELLRKANASKSLEIR